MCVQAVEETAYLCHCTSFYTVRFSLPDRRCAQLVWASICLIVTGPVGAQGVCWAPPPVDVNVSDSAATDTLDISARGFAGVIGGTTEFTGDVSFSFRGNAISAEQASVSSDRSNIELLGSIDIESPEFAITGDDARVDRTGGEISISRAELTLLEMPARARADDIVIRSTRTISLHELHFTTCPVDDVDWELVARALEIDTDAGFGKARGVVFRFKGVPLIYLPVLSFPVDERRKSGFLTPGIAERDRTGFDLTLPYYLNLAENYDLLLEPRYMSERGVQIGSSFRYLMPATDGSLAVEYMRDDRSIDRPRLFVNFEHASSFGSHWDLNADIENVSDPAYFEDLGDSLGSISQTHLDRFVDLGYYAERWSMLTRMHQYQTIDSQIAEADRPYERKPQVYFSGAWGDRIVGFDAYAEAVDFDRSIGETGWRFDSMQELSLRFGRGGFYLTPAIGVRQTSYRIDRTPTTPARNPSRNLPVASLDTGLKFERSAGRDRTWTQTIEPRLLYVRIPYEDQSALPVFDTLIPDFNLVQLFSKFQFVGADRIADANRVSFGLTTRLFSGNGREHRQLEGNRRYESEASRLVPR